MEIQSQMHYWHGWTVFGCIGKLNNWSEQLKVHAFPLYLWDFAHTWFLTLTDETMVTLTALFDGFSPHFASGPPDWILSQQLSECKNAPNGPIILGVHTRLLSLS